MFLALFFLCLPLLSTSSCYYSAFYGFEPPVAVVDCNFDKGHFCYAKRSLDNSTHFRFGCDNDSGRITKTACDNEPTCLSYTGKLCCCQTPGCNAVNSTTLAIVEIENNPTHNRTNNFTKISIPLIRPDRRHLNKTTVGILILCSIVCIVAFIPLLRSISSALKLLRHIEKFYLYHLQKTNEEIKIAKKINSSLLRTLFLEELVVRLNTLRRYEELSVNTLVLYPRQRNTDILEKLENDPLFLPMVKKYAIAKEERKKKLKLRRREARLHALEHGLPV